MNIFLIVLLSFCLKSAEAEKPVAFVDLGDVFRNIQHFFTFLCTRCQEVVLLVDRAIDSQSLKKDANQLCQSVLGFNEIVERVCMSVVEDILGEIYHQLNKFEPNREICAHIHLCDSCSVGNLTDAAPSATNQPLPDPPLSDIEPFTHYPRTRLGLKVDEGALFSSIVKLHHVVFKLAQNSTDFGF